MRIKDLATGRSDLFLIDPRLIQVEAEWNVRQHTAEYAAGIRELALSIQAEGVKEPLRGYLKDDVPTLTNGHRRLEAVQLLLDEGVEIKSVPFLPEERYANDADRMLTMFTSNSGVPLTALEKAVLFKRLLAFGWDVSQVAKRTGLSISHVRHILDLGAAPTSVQASVADGDISATTAVAITREHGEAAPAVIAQAVAKAAKRGAGKATAQDFVPSEGRLMAAAKRAFNALPDAEARQFRDWVIKIEQSSSSIQMGV